MDTTTQQQSILNGEGSFRVENDDTRKGQPGDLTETIEIVTRTWALVKPDSLKHGVVFYKRLFTQHPEERPLFSFMSDEDANSVEETPAMQRQARKLMTMIDYAVRSLRNLSELVPKLRKLGRKHSEKYHVKPEHFQPVGDSLLWTLKEGLGEIYTRDVEAAWTTIYTMLADVMIQGGKEGNPN